MEKHRTSNLEHRTSNQPNSRTFDLEDRLLEYASAVIDISEKLPNSRARSHVASQLLRSGTSPYANHGEAESAESAEDFIPKLKVCLKELRENRRWLRLIHRKNWLGGDPQLKWAAGEGEELIRIFVASVRTAQRNRLRSKSGREAAPDRS